MKKHQAVTITGLAFKYFSDEKVDIGIIETGLGGRLDATNVITPKVSIISNVATEHTKWLGFQIKEIAEEKAGIIKPGVPVVTAASNLDARRVIRKTCEKNKSKLILGLDFHSTWYDVFYTNKKREGTTLPNFIEDWYTNITAISN